MKKSLNKLLISNKLIEKKKDNIKESKKVIKEIKEIKPVKPINTIKMFDSEFENININQLNLNLKLEKFKR